MSGNGDYISREAAIELLSEPITMSMCLSTSECRDKIAQREMDLMRLKSIPAADVRENKRGHWITDEEAERLGDYMLAQCCSVCHACEWDCTESESFHFCPNCGADMRPKEE